MRRLLPATALGALVVMAAVFPARANDAVQRLARMCGRADGATVAHRGIPVAVATSQDAGPYAVSLWATPDTGAGMLHIVVLPRDGVLAPREVRVALRGASGSEVERVYRAYPEPTRHGVRFAAAVTLPRVESWQVRVMLDGASGPGELRSSFASVAPSGNGLAGLALAAVPFVLVAGLWGPLRLVRRPTSATRPASIPSP
jgi:hypothetical protein